MKFCKVYHFADDTNLFCQSNSVKKLKPLVNADLKHLVNWFNANKISLNVKKTEIIVFKYKQNKFEGDLKIKLCGKRLYILLKVSNAWVWKLIQILVGSTMLMIFILIWIEPILSFSKWENMLVIKY